jgi:hypothetical protein
VGKWLGAVSKILVVLQVLQAAEDVGDGCVTVLVSSSPLSFCGLSTVIHRDASIVACKVPYGKVG